MARKERSPKRMIECLLERELEYPNTMSAFQFKYIQDLAHAQAKEQELTLHEVTYLEQLYNSYCP